MCYHKKFNTLFFLIYKYTFNIKQNKKLKTETLHKICANTGFDWPVFSSIRIESTILFLCGRIRVSENTYPRMFYAVKQKYVHNYSLESCQSNSFQIKLTKTPDFSVLWMFVIPKEYGIIYSNQLYSVKRKVCNTLQIYKEI